MSEMERDRREKGIVTGGIPFCKARRGDPADLSGVLARLESPTTGILVTRAGNPLG